MITVANASASEGDNLVFTVYPHLDSEDNQTVSYAVSNGTAESGDYDGSADALTGTVTFAPGQLRRPSPFTASRTASMKATRPSR